MFPNAGLESVVPWGHICVFNFRSPLYIFLLWEISSDASLDSVFPVLNSECCEKWRRDVIEEIPYNSGRYPTSLL